MHMFINESGSRLFRIKWWIKMKYYKIVLELYFDTVEKYLRGPYPDVSNNWSMFYPQTQMLRPNSCKQWHLLSTTIEQTALTILRDSFLLNTHSKKKTGFIPQTVHRQYMPTSGSSVRLSLTIFISTSNIVHVFSW